MPIYIPLGPATLVIKKRRHLRREERERRVPIFQIGSFYLIWRRAD